jgi:UDP-N-acetylglucosamine 4-epimerase
LSEYDPKIANIEVQYGPKRDGDIPHSMASIKKAELNINYNPKYNFRSGLKETVICYYDGL